MSYIVPEMCPICDHPDDGKAEKTGSGTPLEYTNNVISMIFIIWKTYLEIKTDVP